jgi:hypothetical protein
MKNYSAVFFAVRGSSRAANSLANEIVLRSNGQAANLNLSLGPDEKACDPDIHFIQSNIPNLHLRIDKQVEILVPSIRAMFEMQTWHLAVEPNGKAN